MTMVKFLALLWFLTIFSSCFATIDIFRKIFKKGGHQKNQVQYYPVAMQPSRGYDSYETTGNSDEGGKYHWFSKLKPWSHKEYQPLPNNVPNINSANYGPPSFPSSYFPPPTYDSGVLNYPKLEPQRPSSVYLPPPLQQPQPLPQPPTIMNSNGYQANKLDSGPVAYYLVPGYQAMSLKPQLIYGTPMDSKGSEGEGAISAEIIADMKNPDVKCD